MLFSFLPVYSAGSYKDIRVGVSGRTQPLLFIDKNGDPQGVYVDIMNELARIGDLNVEYVVFDRQNQAVEALERGDVDAVLGVLENDYESYPNLRSSSEIYSASTCLVTSVENAEKVLNMPEEGYLSAAYELGTATYSQVSQLNATPIRIMGTQEQLYDALRSGSVDMVMAVRDCMQYMMSEDDLNDQYVVAFNYMTSVSYAILLNRNDHLRFNAISGSINRLRSSSDYDKIIDKWIVNTDLEQAENRIQRLTMILGAVFGIAGMVFAVIVTFNQQLRRLVDEKTGELKEKVEELENAYTLRNKLVEHSTAANLVVKLDGTVLLMNDIARRMENIPIEQPELPNIEAMHIIGQAWARSPAEMEQPELLVMRDEKGGRHTYRYQCHRTSIPDERVFIVEDVTSEEQEKQEIFEESKNKALNRIISGIAHEIKNPLTTIRTYASLAKDQGNDPEFLESFQEYVPREVDRISKMIETLMNYSRPPRGQIERFAMSSDVDHCLGDAYIASKEKTHMEPVLNRALYVKTSKEPIRQALVNLLMNSVESVESKLTTGIDPSDLFIQVRVYQRESYVVTEVYDTGVGMTEEQVQQCTDPFFTTKTTGTGMGLAMSKMYIRETGGSLEVESVLGSYTVMRMVYKEDRENVEA